MAFSWYICSRWRFSRLSFLMRLRLFVNRKHTITTTITKTAKRPMIRIIVVDVDETDSGVGFGPGAKLVDWIPMLALSRTIVSVSCSVVKGWSVKSKWKYQSVNPSVIHSINQSMKQSMQSINQIIKHSIKSTLQPITN